MTTQGEKRLMKCLAVSTQYRRVTDGLTDGRRDRHLATASRRAVIISKLQVREFYCVYIQVSIVLNSFTENSLIITFNWCVVVLLYRTAIRLRRTVLSETYSPYSLAACRIYSRVLDPWPKYLYWIFQCNNFNFNKNETPWSKNSVT